LIEGHSFEFLNARSGEADVFIETDLLHLSTKLLENLPFCDVTFAGDLKELPAIHARHVYNVRLPINPNSVPPHTSGRSPFAAANLQIFDLVGNWSSL